VSEYDDKKPGLRIVSNCMVSSKFLTPMVDVSVPKEGVHGRHEPRKMFSKPPCSQMSTLNGLALPLNVRIDIIAVINNIF